MIPSELRDRSIEKSKVHAGEQRLEEPFPGDRAGSRVLRAGGDDSQRETAFARGRFTADGGAVGGDDPLLVRQIGVRE